MSWGPGGTVFISSNGGQRGHGVRSIRPGERSSQDCVVSCKFPPLSGPQLNGEIVSVPVNCWGSRLGPSSVIRVQEANQTKRKGWWTRSQ